MTICFADDPLAMEFVAELQTDRATAVWYARLSDGREVVMDDGRPGEEQPSAWLRLADHCLTQNVRVTALWLAFRSHVLRHILPENAEGYFFCKNAVKTKGLRDTLSFYLVGHVDGDRVHIQRWRVPGLMPIGAETRSLSETALECLIRGSHENRSDGSQAAPAGADISLRS